MGRIKSGWDALQSSLRQPVESITRTARIDIAGSGVDEVDPPDDIDEFFEQAKNTGIVRSNLSTFVSDVVEPGARIEADSDQTEAYFNGGDGTPEDTPDGGFLENCFVLSGERHKRFHEGLKSTVMQRWGRGTAMVEYLKRDKDSQDSEVTGFYHIRPEIVHAQVQSNKNILLDPDPEAESNEGRDFKDTRRGEVAAYILFSDRSILGRRRGGLDENEVRLSQNDVLKQTLHPDIAGDSHNEKGIFGESIIKPISTDIAEYHEIKRDRSRAIKTKAYGLWDASFNIEVHDTQEEQIVTEWSEESQNEWTDEAGNIGPGDIIGHDGNIDLQRFPAEVPQLDSVLEEHVDSITAPLPAPKYAVGFERNINQFVTERQENRYEDLVREERRYQEKSWTEAMTLVADRKGLDTSGLKVVIEPEEDESPVRSLDAEDIEKIGNYTSALNDVYGNGGAPSYVDEETLLTLVLQLPEDSLPDDIEELPNDLTGGQQQQPPEQPPPPEGEQDQPGDSSEISDDDQIAAQFQELINGQ